MIRRRKGSKSTVRRDCHEITRAWNFGPQSLTAYREVLLLCTPVTWDAESSHYLLMLRIQAKLLRSSLIDCQLFMIAFLLIESVTTHPELQ